MSVPRSEGWQGCALKSPRMTTGTSAGDGVLAFGRTGLTIQGLLIFGPGRESGHCEAGSSQPDRIADGFRRPQPALFEGL